MADVPRPLAPLAPPIPPMRLVWRRLRRNWLSVGALAVIAAMLLAAALANWIIPYDPDGTDVEATLHAPSLAHWLGTDIYGRDLLSRIVFAARVDLTVAFGATGLALVIGSTIGAIAGLYRGLVDLLIMRCVDSVMAFPAFILAMAITAAHFYQIPLPEIAQAVGDKITVLLDSGVRRGSDIVKALALGAKCVLTGRATLYGTAVGGEAGASKAVGIIKTEMDKTMAYTGCNGVDEISTDIFFGDSQRNTMMQA